MIKAGIIGFAHMHVNEIVLYAYEHPNFVLAGGADIPPTTPENKPARYTRDWNKNFVSEKYGLPVFDDVDTMLEEAKPDVVFILCENSKKLEAVKKAAALGIDCIIEKPMAMNADEAKEILKIREETGVDIFVNWPIAWRGYLYEVKEIANSGIIGKPIKIEAHAGHTGPLGVGAKHRGVTETAEELTDNDRASTWWYKNSEGGGAYLDMLCYGAMYSMFYTEKVASSVSASAYNLNTKYADIIDNVTALYEYDDILAIADATWTTPGALLPAGPTVFCENGAVRPVKDCDGNVTVEAYNLSGEKIETPKFEFPSSMKNMMWHYNAYKNEGKPIEFILKLENNVKVMEMIDATVKACENGKTEIINADR